MILQRYTFGSKSQQAVDANGTPMIAYDIAKIYIWKQITTSSKSCFYEKKLLMILQRYTFGSKSQPNGMGNGENHIAYDIAKIYIWKQITTFAVVCKKDIQLLMILQRYTFGSKSQLLGI